MQCDYPPIWYILKIRSFLPSPLSIGYHVLDHCHSPICYIIQSFGHPDPVHQSRSLVSIYKPSWDSIQQVLCADFKGEYIYSKSIQINFKSQGGQQFTNQAYFNNFKFGLEVSFGRENRIFLVSYIQNASYQWDLNIILCLKIAMTTKSLNEIYENAIIQCW